MSFLNILLTFTLSSLVFSCPDWTVPYNSKCYLVVNSSSPNFMSSEAACNCYGGHLATVDSGFENMFVNKELKSFNYSNAWLGLVRLYNESDSSNYTWSWTEGRQIGYDAWAVGEPKRDNVGYFSNGKWNTFWYFNVDSYNGVTIKNYVCQIPNDGLHCPRTNGTNYWTYYSSINSCYQYNRKSDTFDNVYENCDQLLSIHSQEESDILLNYITASGIASYSCSAWVGIMDPYKNGSWQWADGSPLNYTNWAPGEPRNVGTNDCATFLLKDHNWLTPTTLWKSTPCTASAIGICKTPAQLQTDQTMPKVCKPVSVWSYPRC